MQWGYCVVVTSTIVCLPLVVFLDGSAMRLYTNEITTAQSPSLSRINSFLIADSAFSLFCGSADKSLSTAALESISGCLSGS